MPAEPSRVIDPGSPRAPLGITPLRLLLIGAATALGSLSIDLYLPAFPELAQELHTSQAAVQVSLTACVIGLAVGQLLNGPLSDVVGRRAPIVLGLLGWSVTSFLCALAPSITTLTALRFAQGLAGSAGIVVARAVIRDLAGGDQLVRAFARLMLVVGVVPILAPTLGGLLLRVVSWRGLFVVLGVLGAAFTAAVYFALAESLPPSRRVPGGMARSLRGYRVLLRDRSYVGSALVLGCTFAALFTYVSSSSFVLRNTYGLDTTQFGLMFAAHSVALVAGNQLSGLLSGRFSPRSHLLTAICAATVAAVLLLVDGATGAFGFFGVAVPIAMTVFGIGMALPLASSAAMAGHPERAGAASALLGMFQFTIGGLVAPVVGVIGTTSFVPLGVAILGCLLAAAGLQAYATRRQWWPAGPAPRDLDAFVPAGH
jgi:DHA1 family bicyclomycin/chloramphenicol resistance-like MFS transporter